MIIKRHTTGGEKAKPRKIGDAPAIGNVPRASTENPTGRKKRSVRSTRRKKLPKRFFAWAGIICFLAVCALVVTLVRYDRDKEAREQNSATSPEKPASFDLTFEKDENSGLPDLQSDEAIGIVNKALANRDPGLIRDFFILGKGDTPELAMEELVRISDAEGSIARTEWLGLKFPNGSTVLQVYVFTAREGKERARTAQFVQDADGKWRIDLDAYLRKCVPPLAEVVTRESGTSLVRVFVDEDHYYHGIYSDETKWKVYALASPEITEMLYAYAKRGSSQDKAMRRIIDTDEKLHRATLGILKLPESGPRQFEISRVIAENWIVGDKDFDESF
jgi:hypothetical protein